MPITLRVRTNLGTQRLSVESDSVTVAQLLAAIRTKLNIANPLSQLTLSLDIAGTLRLTDLNATIQEARLRNGDEVVVLGKFAERVVEKAFVNEQHELVAAGKSLELVEPPPDENNDEAQAKRAENLPIVEEKPAVVAEKEEKASTEDCLSRPSQTMPSERESLTDFIEPKALEEHYPFGYQFEEDAVRAPDNAQQMQLLADPSAALNDEELQQVNALRQQLRAAGLNEYSVEQEALTFIDELIARRLHNERHFTNNGFNITSLDDLERIVAPGRLRLAQMRAEASSSSNPRLPARTGGEDAFSVAQIHSRLSHKYDMLSQQPRRAPVAARNNEESSTDRSTRLRTNGERVINSGVQRERAPGAPAPPRSPDEHVPSHTRLFPPALSAPAPVRITHRGPVRADRLREKAEEEAAQAAAAPTPSTAAVNNNATADNAAAAPVAVPRQSLAGSDYRPFSHFRQEVNAGRRNDHIQRVPTSILKDHKGPHRRRTPPLQNSNGYAAYGRGYDREESEQHTEDDALQIALALSLQEENEKKEREQREATTRREQEERDAAIEEEERQRQRQRQNQQRERQEEEAHQRRATAEREAKQRALRDHLHRDRPLSPSLRRAVDQSTEDELLQLALQRSLEEQREAPPVAVEEEVLPFYDEDDEMLARALQESLNGIF